MKKIIIKSAHLITTISSKCMSLAFLLFLISLVFTCMALVYVSLMGTGILCYHIVASGNVYYISMLAFVAVAVASWIISSKYPIETSSFCSRRLKF